MIRPITVICWILALGAGLYLYRAKHEVELMDKHIEQVARATTDTRAESRHLLDEWIRLGEPEQLRKYSDEYLGLRAIEPPQFVRLVDLSSRLPPPQADPVDEPSQPVALSDQPGAPAAAQTASTDQAEQTDDADADPDQLPVPPIPPDLKVLAAVQSVPANAAPIARGAMVTPISSSAVVIPLQARPVTPPRAST